MDDLSDILILLLVIGSSFVGSIAKTMKKRKETKNKRKPVTPGTSANRQPEARAARRHDFPDTVSVDENGTRVFAEISYEELRKTMTDDDIARRYPVEYERHLQELKLADIARREAAVREAKPSGDAPFQEIARQFDEGGRSLGKTALHHHPQPLHASIGTPRSQQDLSYTAAPPAPDLSTPESARAAFIASEILTRKYL